MSNEHCYDVFVSYSHEDRLWVRDTLLPRIENSGLRVFIDFRDFQVGAKLVAECERGVMMSRKTLVVLTPAFLASPWTELESVLAQHRGISDAALRLVPVLKEPCEPPLRIRALTYVDLTSGRCLDHAWGRLLIALCQGLRPEGECGERATRRGR